jgi:hypothetical protein
MPEIYKVKDKSESFYIKKDKIFDLPFRLIINGKSQLSGKSNLLINLLLRDEFYLNDFFKGENIYIISPSLNNDFKLKKLIEVKNIPESNLFNEYDESVLNMLYDELQNDYETKIAENQKPEHKLVVFDDMSFGGALKKHKFGIISKLFCNGRHLLISSILTTQKYSDILTTCRTNANGVILFNTNNYELEQIMLDHNFLDSKKEFIKMFRDATIERHDFLVVNYTNPKDEIYLNSKFEKI